MRRKCVLLHFGRLELQSVLEVPAWRNLVRGAGMAQSMVPAWQELRRGAGMAQPFKLTTQREALRSCMVQVHAGVLICDSILRQGRISSSRQPLKLRAWPKACWHIHCQVCLLPGVGYKYWMSEHPGMRWFCMVLHGCACASLLSFKEVSVLIQF